MRILVVDDDKSVREIVERILVKLGHTVAVADSGRTGFEFITNSGVDLVVTDNNMAGMTGIEFLAAARKADIATPFILISGLASTLTSAEKEDFAAVIQKPFTFDQLQAAITQFQFKACH